VFLNAQSNAETSGAWMRRDVNRGIIGPPDGSAVGGLVGAHANPVTACTAVIASTLVPPPPPPAVPIEDPTQHLVARSLPHQRVLIRPAANMAQPAMTYVGQDANVAVV